MRTTFNPRPNPRPHANPNPNPNQVDPDPNPHPNTNPHPNQVDARYAPVYLGGWQSSRASDLAVNNNFATYSARATAEKLTIDRNEIGDARWFDIAELRRRADAAEAATQPLAGRVQLEVGGLAPGLAPGGGVNTVKSAPLAVPTSAPAPPPRGAPCSSGWQRRSPRGEAGPLGAQPLPRVFERAASKAAHSPPLTHSGALVSTTMLSCLETLQRGRGMRCTERPAYLGTPGQDMVSLG
jgi:hypothetical protein